MQFVCHVDETTRLGGGTATPRFFTLQNSPTNATATDLSKPRRSISFSRSSYFFLSTQQSFAFGIVHFTWTGTNE